MIEKQQRLTLVQSDLQILIHNLHLEPDPDSGEPCVFVNGSSPEGFVCAIVSDGPSTSLLRHILSAAGPDILRSRLEAKPHSWLCTGERRTVDGVLHLQVRDAACIFSLCEHVRSAVYMPERGEPILVGFPENQGGGCG